MRSLKNRMLKEDAGVQMKYTVVHLHGYINEDSYEEGEGEQVASFNGREIYCEGMTSDSIKELLDKVAEKCDAQGGFEWDFYGNYDYEKTGIVEFYNDTRMKRYGNGEYLPVQENDDIVERWKEGKAKLYDQFISVAVECVVVAPKISEDELVSIFRREGV